MYICIHVYVFPPSRGPAAERFARDETPFVAEPSEWPNTRSKIYIYIYIYMILLLVVELLSLVVVVVELLLLVVVATPRREARDSPHETLQGVEFRAYLRTSFNESG